MHHASFENEKQRGVPHSQGNKLVAPPGNGRLFVLGSLVLVPHFLDAGHQLLHRLIWHIRLDRIFLLSLVLARGAISWSLPLVEGSLKSIDDLGVHGAPRRISSLMDSGMKLSW